jgi:membrane-bound lytic murein transglycosylase D
LALSRVFALVIAIGLSGCAVLQAPTPSGSDSGTPTTESAPAASSTVAKGVPPATSDRAGATADTPDASLDADVDLPGRRFDSLWDRIRAGFAMPELPTKLVADKERFYLDRRDYLDRMMTRGGRYLYYIVEEIEKRGLPTELALLPFVESAMNPTALSVAQASGLWQFIPSTGRAFNLEQNWWVDNRRDVVKSTQAALDYLQKIYEMQGRDWFLALASYNWGEGAVARAMKNNQARGRPTDYLSLNMPNETRHYVPKLIALKNILLRADELGLTLPPLANRPYFVTIEKTRPIDLKLAAQFAGMTLAEFLELNPAHNRPVIQASRNNQIKLPADRVDAFLEAVERHGEANKSFATWHPYTLKQGETLEAIAQRGGISPTELRRANGLRPNSRILAGTRLLVPQQASDGDRQIETFIAPRIYEQVDLAPVHHTVGPKDKLATIAARYGVSQAQLRTQNKLAQGEPARGTRLLIRPGGTQTVLITEQGRREIVPARNDTAASGSARTAVATARSQPAVLKAGDCHDAQECRLLAALKAAGSEPQPATTPRAATNTNPQSPQAAPKPAQSQQADSKPSPSSNATSKPAQSQPAASKPAQPAATTASGQSSKPANAPKPAAKDAAPAKTAPTETRVQGTDARPKTQTAAAAPKPSTTNDSTANKTQAAPSRAQVSASEKLPSGAKTAASSSPSPAVTKPAAQPDQAAKPKAPQANAGRESSAGKPSQATEGVPLRTSVPAPGKPAAEVDRPVRPEPARPQT